MKSNSNSIYINGRVLVNKGMDGIKRFAIEICRHLKKQGLDFIIILPKWADFDNTDDFEIIKVGLLKSHLWEQIDLLFFLQKNGNPLLISLSGLGPIWYKRKIVTIHDLAFYHEPKWFARSYSFLYRFATPLIAKYSLKILTVSQFSKNEIVKYLNIHPDKIEIIYNAVSSNSFSNLEYTKKCNYENYILAVSSLDPRKNFKRLIEVFKRPELQFLSLLIVGKERKNFRKDFDAQNSTNIQFLGFVDDVELNMLYKNALFFVYPSLYEGFGIPPLEAMANNCPVAVSDIPSLREICNGAAIYFDPNNIGEIINVINLLSGDNILQEELKSKGRVNLERFSWTQSADILINTLQLLQEVR